MESPFVKYFTALKSQTTLEATAFTPHEDCPVFICPKSGISFDGREIVVLICFLQTEWLSFLRST